MNNVAFLIPLLALYGLFLVVAVQLHRAAKAKNLPNLRWLALNFAMSGVAGFLRLANVPLLIVLLSTLGSMALVMFVHGTFYRDRKSPYKIFLGILLLTGVIQSVLTFLPKTLFSPDYLGGFIVWSWHGVAAYLAYRQLANDKTVEDWVKARYQILLAYSIILVLITGRSIFAIPLPPIFGLVTIILVFVSGIMQYLTWAMPEFFRRFLNRNDKSSAQDEQMYMAMTEEELLKQF